MILLDIKKTAEQTCLSESTINRLRREGSFPEPVKVGDRVLWKAKDLESWADSLGGNQTKKRGRPRLAL